MPTFPTRDNYVALAYSASCCNCAALVFGFLMAISPYYLWVTGYFVAPLVTQSTTLATGAFVLSAMDTRVSLPGVFVFGSQTNYWSEMTSEVACREDSNVYINWASRYGYCDAPNGTFSIPSDVTAVQAFSILTVCFLALSIASGVFVESAGKVALYISAVTSFLAMISAIVSFSVIAANPWNKELLSNEGAYFPVVDSFTGEFTTLPSKVTLFYGPSFGGAIFVFIVTLFATVGLINAVSLLKKAESESSMGDDFVEDGTSGPPGGATGAPETNPGDEGQMYKA